MIAGHLSTTEIEKHTDAVVVIPFGSFEQHGPYLPLLTDSIIAEEIAGRAEKTMPKSILLYPAVWFGDSVEHKGFAGTLSVNAIDMMRMLSNLFEWLAQSGFKRGILFNAHGGNSNLAATVCEDFSRGSSFKVRHLSAYSKNVKELSVELFNVSETHAGSTEMSLVAALRPELVKTKEEVLPNAEPYFGGGRLAFMESRELSKSGVLHKLDTIEIDAERGRQLAEAMATGLVDAVNKFLSLEW